MNSAILWLLFGGIAVLMVALLLRTVRDLRNQHDRVRRRAILIRILGMGLLGLELLAIWLVHGQRLSAWIQATGIAGLLVALMAVGVLDTQNTRVRRRWANERRE